MSVLDEMDYYYEIEARNKYDKEYKENQNPKECSICHKIKPQKDFYKKGGIFTSACKKCIKDRYKNTSKENKQLKDQLQQKENIIKEVREHLHETINKWEDYEQFYEVVAEDKYILGILDKEVN